MFSPFPARRLPRTGVAANDRTYLQRVLLHVQQFEFAAAMATYNQSKDAELKPPPQM